VHIVGTASVKVLTNPFDVFTGKDVTLTTIAAAGATQYTVQASSVVCIEVTSMAAGAVVSARIVYEDGND
jgi:general stress protein CsbA